jgi:hypothetical protein
VCACEHGLSFFVFTLVLWLVLLSSSQYQRINHNQRGNVIRAFRLFWTLTRGQAREILFAGVGGAAQETRAPLRGVETIFLAVGTQHLPCHYPQCLSADAATSIADRIRASLMGTSNLPMMTTQIMNKKDIQYCWSNKHSKYKQDIYT